MRGSLKVGLALAGTLPVALALLTAHSAALKSAAADRAEVGPSPVVRIALHSYGLPDGFFNPDAETKCSGQIIGYRFVVWLNDDTVAAGFNTSPNCRPSPTAKVDGLARILLFNTAGVLQAQRDLKYLADGNGEIVAQGEARAGPAGTLLFRIESVNLDPEGRSESPSGVQLLDAKLKDVAHFDRFLDETTLTDHALVFHTGSPLGGPIEYSILDGNPPAEVKRWTIQLPVGARDSKIGEHGYAFVNCTQELRPGEYTSSKVIYEGSKTRCALNVREDGESSWTTPLNDGENAAILGLLADGAVVGQPNDGRTAAGRLIIWRKNADPEALPWLPPQFEGTVANATKDFSRYTSFATNDPHPCNVLGKILGSTCDETGDGRWFVFDRSVKAPIVDRTFPKNGRAALSPNGLRYASFESGELRIFTLPH